MNQQLSMQQTEETTLQDYVHVIMRRKKILLITFFFVLAVGVLYTLLVPPSYEATATLFVKDDKGKVGQMGDLLLNQPAAVDSELEILKSRSNAEKVVSTLHLNWKIDKASKGASCKLIEFSAAGKEPVFHVELTGDNSYSVKDEDGNPVGTGRCGVLLRGKGVSLLLNDLKGKKGDSFRLTLLPFNKTVKELAKRIRATEVGKKTNLIAITYRNRDPQVATNVVNTLVQAYLEQGVALKSEEATRTVGFVEDQLKGVKTELDRVEQQLQAYKSSSGVIQLDTEALNLIQTLSDAEKQRAEMVLRRKQTGFALDSLKRARATGSVYAPSVADDDPVLASMVTKLSDLEVEKKGLLSQSTENHPGVKAVQAQIDEQLKNIQSTYETSLKNAVKQEDSLTRQIQHYDGKLKTLPVAERDLARLARVSKVNSDIYTFLLQKHEEAKIAKASTINNISIVDPAIVPDEPAFPKMRVNLALAVVIGLMLGLGLCFIREFFDNTLKEPEEAERALSLPLLALIPFISKKEGEQALISHRAPKSVASEAFKELRTALRFCSLKKQKQVLLITSSLAGEGKSTVACNLAITLTQTGARVLLVDCDLRCSSLHLKLGCTPGAGLTELMAGDIGQEAALHATQVAGLDLVKSGTVPPNPAEILGSEAMARFVEDMRGVYDFIVIDAPPVLAVTDAPVLTAISDLVLIVMEAGRVPAKAAKRTKETLVAAAAPLAGIVFSDSKALAVSYGYEYGYSLGVYNDSRQQRRPWWKFWA
ncbi:MAG TPA: polysaccharide biosynthesis tyrosine autokinase [Geomonas sp.]|nr:polysaccharide biosynthesis tyrosine autokinase [Geomonas sp.]